MQIELVFFAVIFLVIIALLAFKRPLWQAIGSGLIVAILLYQIPPFEVLKCTSNVFTNWNSFSVIVSLYLITYLQQMRNIPESFMPTYSFILLFATLVNVPITQFIGCMIIPILIFILVGYYPYIIKLPKSSGEEKRTGKGKHLIQLLKHLWPILLVLILILCFGLSVVTSVIISIAATGITYKFTKAELLTLIKTAFDPALIINSFLCLVLKEFISYVKVLELLPDALSVLPIPTYLVFVLIFFIGGLFNVTGIIAIGAPLAFSTLSGGAPLMMLLMCVCHAASQVSPTHICVVIAAEHFDISIGALVKRVMPVSLLYCLLIILYYNLLIVI